MRLFLYLLLIFTLGASNALVAQSEDCANTELDKFRVLFLLDASYSMEKKWDNETLWTLAKKTVVEFAYHLQKNYNVEMGLRVYGHNSPISVNDCEDSKLEVPIQRNAAYLISQKLKKIHYKGTTPLTYSLEKAAEDLGCNSKRNIIILITDGYETCNRNPCATAMKLLNYRIAIKPLVIGLNIDYKDIEHLKCIGEFKNAKSKKEFKSALYKSFVDVTNKKSISIFLNNNGAPKSETGMPISIFDSKTKKEITSFFHTLSATSQPDTFVIADYDSIDVITHTIPTVTFPNIKLKNYQPYFSLCHRISRGDSWFFELQRIRSIGRR